MVDTIRERDRLLDYISSLLKTIARQEAELNLYRTLVTAASKDPAHVG